MHEIHNAVCLSLNQKSPRTQNSIYLSSYRALRKRKEKKIKEKKREGKNTTRIRVKQNWKKKGMWGGTEFQVKAKLNTFLKGGVVS